MLNCYIFFLKTSPLQTDLRICYSQEILETMAAVSGDTYIDILEERRISSDIAWVSRRWSCSSCQYSMGRKPHVIKKQVLDSSNVQSIIKKINEESGKEEEEVQSMAVQIVEEMAHNFQLSAIRFFGYVLSKLMKQLYHRILVNKKGLEKVASVSSQYPILFLPTHRSYADFLLVSYICFQFNLPIPVIAAGLDFLGLKTVSTLLRNSGAFFIRRSFIDDRLYWEIFSEYVKTHIQGSEFPIEFFIEGTRSRTAKSLVPKLGMLHVILEEFFASKIPDITIVPISISYDRTLEETLYAYELLGVPKPKESTKGLIKARRILSYDFGNVYVHLGDPISVKDFFKDYERSIHNLHPRNMPVVVKEEQTLCRDIANYVIQMHQSNLVLSTFPLICLVLSHPFYQNTDGVHFDKLVDLVLWLAEVVKRTGASIFTDHMLPSDTVTYQLKLHSNIVEVSEYSVVSVRVLAVDQPIHRLQQTTLKQAVPCMYIYHYSNQALQLLIHLCMLCLSISRDGVDENNDYYNVFSRYNVLRKLLQREFVFGRLSAEKDFSHALQLLKEEKTVDVVESKIIVTDEGEKKFNFLRHLPLHFLYSYHIICQYLTKCTVAEDVNCQSLAHQCQIAVEKAIATSTLCDHRCLSLDIINNCIAFLVNQNALVKVKRGKEVVIVPHIGEIMDVQIEIDYFLPSRVELPVSLCSVSVAPSKL